MRGCQRLLIQSYLDEFMWRQNNNLDRVESYHKILSLIPKVYNDIKFDVNIEKKILDSEEIGEEDLNTASDSETEDENTCHFSLPELDVIQVPVLTPEPVPSQESVEVPVPVSTPEPVPVSTPEPEEEITVITIEHNSTNELLAKFNELVSTISINSKFCIADLNQYKRKIIHGVCQKHCLYHWSETVNNNRVLVNFNAMALKRREYGTCY